MDRFNKPEASASSIVLFVILMPEDLNFRIRFFADRSVFMCYLFFKGKLNFSNTIKLYRKCPYFLFKQNILYIIDQKKPPRRRFLNSILVLFHAHFDDVIVFHTTPSVFACVLYNDTRVAYGLFTITNIFRDLFQCVQFNF